MKATPANEETARVSGGHPKIRTLALAGIVGPTLFTIGILVQPLYRSDTYDAISQLVSDLTAGPYGWVQQVNFIVFGLLVIAFAAGLHLELRPTRAGIAGPALLGFNGIGLLIGGLFPLRVDATGLVYDPLGVHTANGTIFFLSLGLAPAVMSLRLRGDPRWRHLATYTLVTGIALLITVVAIVALVRPTDAPLHNWFGLAQRLVLAIWLPYIVVLALRLRRVRDCVATGSG
jgi:hypothetical membrane protein